MESGINEIFKLALPAVIEVQAGINKPRYASLKGIMQAKKKEIAECSPADLGLSPELIGSAGSRVETVKVFLPESGEGAQIIEGEPADCARALVAKLQKEARVI
jgi:electron transfer flavoprotein beta subunit